MSAYARVAVARTTGGWTVSGNVGTLVADAVFPAMASGAGGTVTHVGLGRAPSGSGELLFFGAISPNLVVAAGVTPKVLAGTTVSQNTGDALANAAATNLLKLLLNNTTWANIGDTTGLVGSGAAGNLYLSLHTSSPAESGDQSTNEIAYA